MRGSYLKANGDVPAPGTYNVVGSLKPEEKKGPSTSAAFRSATKRLVSMDSEVPGPGSYSWAHSGFEAAAEKTKKGTSVFSNANTDRFGRPYRTAVDKGKGVPGPGHYTHYNKPADIAAASSGWALSAVMRDRTASSSQVHPPGPCYYKRNLSTIGKRSFHLNSNKLWL